MTSSVYEAHGAVAVITLNNAPVNGLNHAVRQGIVAGLDQAAADPAVKAVVIIGSDRLFSGGADIGEFGTPKIAAEPSMWTVVDIVEKSTKRSSPPSPGTGAGGAFPYRQPDASIALPEVKLGLLPGGGGTQRLPPAIGVEAALNVIVSGAPAPAERFKRTALFDEFVEGDLLGAALAFAQKVVAEKRPLTLLRDSNWRA